MKKKHLKKQNHWIHTWSDKSFMGYRCKSDITRNYAYRAPLNIFFLLNTKKCKHTSICILCLSVCLSVCIQWRKNGWTDLAKFFCGTSRDPKEGLWIIEISKICLHQNSFFENFETPRNFILHKENIFIMEMEDNNIVYNIFSPSSLSLLNMMSLYSWLKDKIWKNTCKGSALLLLIFML